MGQRRNSRRTEGSKVETANTIGSDGSIRAKILKLAKLTQSSSLTNVPFAFIVVCVCVCVSLATDELMINRPGCVCVCNSNFVEITSASWVDYDVSSIFLSICLLAFDPSRDESSYTLSDSLSLSRATPHSLFAFPLYRLSLY